MTPARSLVLIGFFGWAAENAATPGRAWRYPSQGSVWTLVHPGAPVQTDAPARGRAAYQPKQNSAASTK